MDDAVHIDNRTVRVACLLGILLLALLRLVQLPADPPLNLTTSGVLYTDEGQYARNAVRWALTGQWYAAGDFNPAVIYPVASAVQGLAFETLGVSTTAARAVSVLCAWLSLYLMYRLCRFYVSMGASLGAVLLPAASYRFYAFSRLAILDLPMVAFALLSLTLAVWGARRGSFLGAALAGVAFMGAWWTKLGVYLLPVVLYALWRESSDRRRAAGLIAACLGACLALWAAYALCLALPYRADYRYLMDNVFDRVRPAAPVVARSTAAAAYHALQADPLLAVAVVGVGTRLLFTNPSFRRDPLLALAALWALCRVVSLGSTPYQPPRYFIPIHLSLAMAAACVCEHLWRTEDGRIARPLFALLVLAALVFNGWAIGSYLSAPRYTFQSMCADIARQTAPRAGQSPPVLMGNIADSISLATSIPAVNDRLGTADLATRVRLYQPTHYVSLGPVGPEVAEVLQQGGELSFVRAYDVYDNYYTGEQVRLYALDRR